ncbi:hypothetical protein Tco_0374741 [Tanacetum coccineum]
MRARTAARHQTLLPGGGVQVIKLGRGGGVVCGVRGGQREGQRVGARGDSGSRIHGRMWCKKLLRGYQTGLEEYYHSEVYFSYTDYAMGCSSQTAD